jgi:hypothetical protein
MLRKGALAASAALTLVLTACGGGPSSYGLRGDLCEVRVRPEATDASAFKAEMPRLTAELTDQVLERLREKS